MVSWPNHSFFSFCLFFFFFFWKLWWYGGTRVRESTRKSTWNIVPNKKKERWWKNEWWIELIDVQKDASCFFLFLFLFLLVSHFVFGFFHVCCPTARWDSWWPCTTFTHPIMEKLALRRSLLLEALSKSACLFNFKWWESRKTFFFFLFSPSHLHGPFRRWYA